jgi:hypothetical protein
MHTQVVSIFWFLAIMNIAFYKCPHTRSHDIGNTVNNETSGSYSKNMLTFEELSKLFPKGLLHFPTPSALCECPNLSTHSPTSLISFDYAKWCEVLS